MTGPFSDGYGYHHDNSKCLARNPPAWLPIYDQTSLDSILQKVLGANMGQKKSVMV
jgi:hypothetical protein